MASSSAVEDLLSRIPTKGRDEPRLITPPHGADSYGPAVARWAKRNMPNPPMRWNKLAWDHILTHQDGLLCHRQALISVARQNSKTTACEALVGWWATELSDKLGTPQTIIWLSHDLRLSDMVFAFLYRMLEDRVTYRTFSFGRQRLELDNGSVIAVQSNTVAAGHGFSIDLCIIDESWRVKPEVVSQGIIPAMRARKSPLLVMASTAGDEDSALLKQWRERGLSLIESGKPSYFGMLEWSPPPSIDVHDPKWWSWPNPCLGLTLTPETLLAEYESPDRGAWLRGSMNIWTSTANSWLPAGQWDQCRIRSMPDATGGVVACEVSQAGAAFYAVRAFQLNGVTYAQPLVVTEHEDTFWSALDAVYGDLDQLAISPHLEGHLPPSLARKSTVVGLKELARNVPLVRSMIAAGQVVHGESVLLDEHVGRAVATRTAGLSTAHSSGSIELARCLVWATALSSRPQHSRKPALAVAR